jgi:hypothetical protein
MKAACWIAAGDLAGQVLLDVPPGRRRKLEEEVYLLRAEADERSCVGET